MTIQPSPYDLIRAIQDQQRATDRLVSMLVGMLDGSAPDPVLASLPEPVRRVPSEVATPPVEIDVGGSKVRTTERRARAIRLLEGEELGLSDLVRKNCAPNKKAMSLQLRDINQDFEKAGVPLRIEQAGPRNQFRAARYTLRRLDQNAVAGSLPSVQSGGEAGASPGEGAAARGAGDGSDITSPHAVQSVTPSGAEEGGPAPVDPAPAADDESSEIAGEPTADNPGQDDRLPDQGPVGREGCVIAQLGPSTCETPSGAEAGDAVRSGVSRPPAGKERPPAVPSAAASSRALRMRIEPGDLIAVEIKAREIVTAKGVYHVAGANLARALDALKSGALFGLDIVAKRAGYHSADVARQALMLERSRLAQHGIEVWTDRINVRLRALT